MDIGSQAIDAVFSLSVVGLYIAYGIPIAARWIWHKTNNFQPGAFDLGSFVRTLLSSFLLSYSLLCSHSH